MHDQLVLWVPPNQGSFICRQQFAGANIRDLSISLVKTLWILIETFILSSWLTNLIMLSFWMNYTNFGVRYPKIWGLVLVCELSMYTILWHKKSALQQIPMFQMYGATFKNERWHDAEGNWRLAHATRITHFVKRSRYFANLNKSTMFWNVVSCDPVVVGRFGETNCLHLQVEEWTKETASWVKMLLSYQATCRHIHNHLCQNFNANLGYDTM